MHKKNKDSKPKSNENEAMLIEEFYLSEKRKKTSDVQSAPYPNRNVRTLRSGKETATVPIKKKLKSSTDKVDPVLINNEDTTMVDVATSVEQNNDANRIVIPKSTTVKVASMPNHPLVPVENSKNVVSLTENTSKIDIIVDRIMNDAVHLVSLNDLASLSPVARSKLKMKMTKPQVNKTARVPTNKDNKQEVPTVLLSEEESKLPKGKSAPRAYAEINGVEREVILDGGCTSFIISLNFAKELGISEAEPCDTAVMFGDGKMYHPIGLIKDLRIRLGKSNNLVSINALCYDVGNQYDFIIGREGLHVLGVGTDWSTHYWYMRSDNGVMPLDIHYTKGRIREESDSELETYGDDNDHDKDEDYYIDQDDVEEGYLIMEVTHDNNQYFQEPKEPEKSTSRLVD